MNNNPQKLSDACMKKDQTIWENKIERKLSH